jgi:hypothetical protein
VKIGFTGTRAGMTTIQWETLEFLVRAYNVTEFHSGDCLGADEQAVGIMRKLDPRPKMFGHPCNIEKWRAHLDYDVVLEVKPPLVRNRIIVNRSDLMFAGPQEFENVPVGSGTWATIRYADSKNVPLIIVWPDGNEERRNGA